MKISKCRVKDIRTLKYLYTLLKVPNLDCYWSRATDIIDSIFLRSFYVGRKNKQVIGAVCFMECDNFIWIYSLAVNKRFQKLRYGKEFLDFVIEKAKNKGYPVLKVHTLEFYNVMRFYEKCGFISDGYYDYSGYKTKKYKMILRI